MISTVQRFATVVTSESSVLFVFNRLSASRNHSLHKSTQHVLEGKKSICPTGLLPHSPAIQCRSLNPPPAGLLGSYTRNGSLSGRYFFHFHFSTNRPSQGISNKTQTKVFQGKESRKIKLMTTYQQCFDFLCESLFNICAHVNFLPLLFPSLCSER